MGTPIVTVGSVVINVVDNEREKEFWGAVLGGSHLEDHEMEVFAWKVMTDPEGNKFCITLPDAH